jgi:hypothetical protein
MDRGRLASGYGSFAYLSGSALFSSDDHQGFTLYLRSDINSGFWVARMAKEKGVG